MKPSHLRTPRALSECYFEVGHYTLEPAMWQDRWNGEAPIGYTRSSNWKLIISIVVGVGVVVAMLTAPLL